VPSSITHVLYLTYVGRKVATVSTIKLGKENNRRVRWLSEDEEVCLLGVLSRNHQVLVLVAVHTGMRKGEQLSLRWTDIDFHQRRLTIRESKSGEARYIPLNEVAVAALQKHPKMIDNPYVFYGRNPGQPMHNGIKNNDWKRYLGEAGIENLKWHDLRHSFASRLVMRGVDLYTVSKLLGHQSLEMTGRYAHLAPEYLKNAVDLLTSPVQVTPNISHVS